MYVYIYIHVIHIMLVVGALYFFSVDFHWQAWIYIWLCLLVRQPDLICRAIGQAIMYFSSMRSAIGLHFFKSCYVPRSLCTESAVPEEATRQWKVPGQESNGECSLTLGALNPSSLKGEGHAKINKLFCINTLFDMCN